MDYKLTKEKNVAKFTIEVSAEDFALARKKAYAKRQPKINVPGFRKGKVPQQMAENYYGIEAFYDDAINEILPDLYDEAIKALELDTVSRPDIDVDEVSAAKGVVLKIEVALKPVIDVQNYKGIEAEKIDDNVTDDEVLDVLKTVQERNSRLITVDKPLENGDMAYIDFEGFVDDEPFEGGKGQNYPLEIGSGTFIPGFEEQLVGKKKGEEVDVKVKFPEDYRSEEVKGKDAVFKVKICDTKKREVSELDDDFAQDVSEFDTLEEFKEDIKKKLQEDKIKQSQVELENALLDSIISKLDIDVPEPMIMTQISHIAHDMDHHLQHQGMTLEQYFQISKITPETFIEENRERAEQTVKAQLAVEDIAKKEGLDLNDENYPTKVLDILVKSAIIKEKKENKK